MGYLHLVADIPYMDPEEETEDSEDLYSKDPLAIKKEVKTLTPTKGRKSQKNPTSKAGHKTQKKSKTLLKNIPSPRIKKEPTSTSKQVVTKPKETTPPIKEEEPMESQEAIFNEEDRFSDDEEHLVSQSLEEDVTDEVRTHTRLIYRQQLTNLGLTDITRTYIGAKAYSTA